MSADEAASSRPSFEDTSPHNERRAGADPLVGMVVADRYRIVSPLGSGGMGVVYKVEHVRIGKLMAMKLLSGEFSRDPAIIRRFKREALLASRLSHPNTVQVFDYGQADGLTYLVMELVPGVDLSRVLRADGPLPAVRVARLIVQICASLSEAHGAGIVHRDLKPENVLLVKAQDGKSEIAKVCDFGVAKLRAGNEASNDVTSVGAVVGTPYYMSPEQIRGEDVDHRSDIYSLGGVIYRLLTGHPPFSGPNPMAVFAKHLTEEPTPPSQREPTLGIPRALDAIVLRALQKQRDKRYSSVDEMQAELMDLLRANNASSIDILVDQGKLEELAIQVSRQSVGDTGNRLPGAARRAATRDEVESFERKLRVQRRIGQVALLAVLVGAGALGFHAFKVYTAPRPYDGAETEPNNSAAEANVIPFGEAVRGQIGRRLAAGTSDRDFFAFEVPTGVAQVQLRTAALPNFATCTWLYRSGMSEPLARFCAGAAGRPLEVGAYRVEPGRYLLAVLQDMDPYGAASPPPVYENISDDYSLEFTPTPADPAAEVEPDDSVPTANRVAAGAEVRGSLGFLNDVDVYCPGPQVKGAVRWVIRDALDRPRDAGAVLGVELTRGSKDPLKILVHRAGVAGKPDATNVVSPYSSPAVSLDGDPTTGCVRLRLMHDPWTTGGPPIPSPGREPYQIKLEVTP
jgi:serine/threonine-protein kinase